MALTPLSADALHRCCDADALPFETTADLPDLEGIVGQDRAIAAVRFGVGIRRPGYNMYALGPAGTGKHTTIRKFLEAQAKAEPAPDDWCYVNNFATAHKPVAIRLPAGSGSALKRDMDSLVDDLKSAIPAIFESDDYTSRRQAIDEAFKEQQEGVFETLQEKAKAKNIALIRTPVGLALAPVRDGAVVKPEVFEKLPEDERKRVEADIEELQQELEQIVRKMPQWDKERRDKIRELSRDVTKYAVEHLIDALRGRYSAYRPVVDYLDAVQNDVVENVEVFLSATQETPAQQPTLPVPVPVSVPGGTRQAAFRRYQVNVVVDNSGVEGAPVVLEDNPGYGNLVGRVEHIQEMGALVTDFGLIKAGALHRANGGYLILDAAKLLAQPYAYEGLKRALRGAEIRIESLGQALSLISTVSLEPEAIPLNTKVVLIGDRRIYYLLCQLDPEFTELFKVQADFDDVLQRDDESVTLYARLIATLARGQNLRDLDRGGVARVIERSARLAEDSERLTARLRLVTDLLQEADYWAGKAGRDLITAEDVQAAIDAQIHRSDRIRERSQEMIERGTVLIDTEGAVVGQINGLSVLMLGNYSFGRPSRITTRVRMGAGEVVDIERKVELGGPIHSKGVLILSSFLGSRYAQERPLSLGASLVFEQSYGGVDGDSASSAELYALLSALAEIPIRQNFAVTGSVNQRGQVQAIGGVNEKIEGFFDLCRARGLSGDQGVLIPASNVVHLMLRQDVVDAVKDGTFHIYPVETVDQGIEILTGIPAGERDAAGAFPAGSVNRMVEDRLIGFAEARRKFGRPGKGGRNGEGDANDNGGDGGEG